MKKINEEGSVLAAVFNNVQMHVPSFLNYLFNRCKTYFRVAAVAMAAEAAVAGSIKRGRS